MENNENTGTLYLCATPIGNLEDITIRVLNILKNVPLIAAEDTRHTRKLLNHYEITTPSVSYHEHNKHQKGPMLIEKLKQGVDIALVTDAGMPGISDPGEDLAKLCFENNIPVTVAPGASACVTALALSGLSTRRFLFEGFLPSDKKERREVLEGLKKEHRTIVLYEAPHRLSDTLLALYESLGEREGAVIRELTKKYEQIKKGNLSALCEYYAKNQPKGEFVIVLSGVSLLELKKERIEKWAEISIENHMLQYINTGMNEKDAMKKVAKDRGVSKREIYSYVHKEIENE